MSESRAAKPAMHAPGARFSARFWDGVEYEVERLDEADFALFLAADLLAIEPRAGFADRLGASLAGVCRTRFSN